MKSHFLLSQLRCVVPLAARWVITAHLACCGRRIVRRYQSRQVAAVVTVTFLRVQISNVSRVSLSLLRLRLASIPAHLFVCRSRRHHLTAVELLCTSLQSHVSRCLTVIVAQALEYMSFSSLSLAVAASLGSGAISTAPPLITHGLAPRKQPFKAPRKLTLRKPPLKGTSQCNTSLSCDAGAVAETTLPVVTGLTAPTVSAGLGNSVLRATTATVSRTARLPLAARGTKGSGVNQPFKPVVVSKRNGR